MNKYIECHQVRNAVEEDREGGGGAVGKGWEFSVWTSKEVCLRR